MKPRGNHDCLTPPLRDEALLVPALDRRRWNSDLGGHGANPIELLEYTQHLTTGHDVRLPHHNRTFCVRQSHFPCESENRTLRIMDPSSIIEGLKRLGVPHDRIAEVICRDRTTATKLVAGKRSIKAHEIAPLEALIAEFEEEAGEIEIVRRTQPLAESIDEGLIEEYCQVEVLPTHVGMGAGGTGEGDRRIALLPRSLVEGQLHARPEDLLVIEVRGTSMEPDFRQGDQILIDRRDRDTRQGGPFALFDGDTYVLKNVEQLPGAEAKLRIFSTNRLFTDWLPAPGEARIEGRPVWYARRL